jgi:sphinganine-1-phosphate aldolase
LIAGKYKWEEGRVSGAVYAGDATVGDLCTEVYHRTVWSNPLHPDMFADVRRMEAEVVRMCCDLFNGDADSCGAMTSGGTESIVLACKAYRDRAHARGIDQPEIVVPITAHAAFEKAAQLMDCRIRYVPVDEQTRAVTVRAMRRAITKNTCLIMGSAPCFPYGTIDPIAQLSQLALKCRVPLHVDCCLGGFLVPFAQRAGFKLDPKRPCEGPAQPIGFELPGVTSISCDPHKYGFTPKGSSVVLYRSNELRNYQYFTCTDWPGGIYASPTLAGSRSGALIATCWATMLHHGVDKYVKATREILNTAKYLEEEIRKMPALQILGRVDAMVVAFTAAPSPTNRRKPRFNIYVLKELMEKRGWSLNALQFPPGVHVAVTALSVKPGVAQQLIADLKAAVTELETRTDIKEGDYAAFYGSTQQIPDRSLVSRLCGLFLDACYSLEDR